MRIRHAIGLFTLCFIVGSCSFGPGDGDLSDMAFFKEGLRQDFQKFGFYPQNDLSNKSGGKETDKETPIEQASTKIIVEDFSTYLHEACKGQDPALLASAEFSGEMGLDFSQLDSTPLADLGIDKPEAFFNETFIIKGVPGIDQKSLMKSLESVKSPMGLEVSLCVPQGDSNVYGIIRPQNYPSPKNEYSTIFGKLEPQGLGRKLTINTSGIYKSDILPQVVQKTFIKGSDESQDQPLIETSAPLNVKIIVKIANHSPTDISGQTQTIASVAGDEDGDNSLKYINQLNVRFVGHVSAKNSDINRYQNNLLKSQNNDANKSTNIEHNNSDKINSKTSPSSDKKSNTIALNISANKTSPSKIIDPKKESPIKSDVKEKPTASTESKFNFAEKDDYKFLDEGSQFKFSQFTKPSEFKTLHDIQTQCGLNRPLIMQLKIKIKTKSGIAAERFNSNLALKKLQANLAPKGNVAVKTNAIKVAALTNSEFEFLTKLSYIASQVHSGLEALNTNGSLITPIVLVCGQRGYLNYLVNGNLSKIKLSKVYTNFGPFKDDTKIALNDRSWIPAQKALIATINNDTLAVRLIFPHQFTSHTVKYFLGIKDDAREALGKLYKEGNFQPKSQIIVEELKTVVPNEQVADFTFQVENFNGNNISIHPISKFKTKRSKPIIHAKRPDEKLIKINGVINEKFYGTQESVYDKGLRSDYYILYGNNTEEANTIASFDHVGLIDFIRLVGISS